MYQTYKASPIYQRLLDRIYRIFAEEPDAQHFLLEDRPHWEGGRYIPWLDSLSDDELVAYVRNGLLKTN